MNRKRALRADNKNMLPALNSLFFFLSKRIQMDEIFFPYYNIRIILLFYMTSPNSSIWRACSLPLEIV